MAVECLVGYRLVCSCCGVTGPFEENKGDARRSALVVGWESNTEAQGGDRCPLCRRDQPAEGVAA